MNVGKFREEKKDLYMVFIDLEKEYGGVLNLVGFFFSWKRKWSQ